MLVSKLINLSNRYVIFKSGIENPKYILFLDSFIKNLESDGIMFGSDICISESTKFLELSLKGKNIYTNHPVESLKPLNYTVFIYESDNFLKSALKKAGIYIFESVCRINENLSDEQISNFMDFALFSFQSTKEVETFIRNILLNNKITHQNPHIIMPASFKLQDVLTILRLLDNMYGTFKS